MVTAGGSSSPASDSETAGSKINERALLRKLDMRLLPAVGILYLLSFLDRSNGNVENSLSCFQIVSTNTGVYSRQCSYRRPP